MRMKLLFGGAVFGISLNAVTVFADGSESRLSVPVDFDLNGLRAFVENTLPRNPLHRNEYGRTCVEPERACTKVPEFRGLKVTMKNRCVEVTPRIDCTITERIDRQNSLEIFGSGSTISVRQDLVGSGTVRGRGEIGKNIRQTVRAAAEFTVTTTPILHSDWSITAETSITKRWLQRPEFKLFNAFPVTIGSQIDPALDAAMRSYSAEVPSLLAELGVREKAEDLWTSLQDPVPLALEGDRMAYLHLRPQDVSFHGINVSGSNLRTGLSLSVLAMANTSADGPEKTTLPDLSELPDDGFRILLPVHLDFETLNGLATGLLPYEAEIEGQSVTIQSVNATSDGEKLVMKIDVEVERGVLAALSGPMQVHATPILDARTQLLALDNIELSGVDGQTSFLRSAALRLASGFIQDRFEISLAANMERLSQELTKTMNGPLSEDFGLSGAGEMHLIGISLNERPETLTATFAATGQVSVIGFNPFE